MENLKHMKKEILKEEMDIINKKIEFIKSFINSSENFITQNLYEIERNDKYTFTYYIYAVDNHNLYLKKHKLIMETYDFRAILNKIYCKLNKNDIINKNNLIYKDEINVLNENLINFLFTSFISSAEDEFLKETILIVCKELES